jgi:hypothetical protein
MGHKAVVATLRYGVLRIRLPARSSSPHRVAISSSEPDDIVELGSSDIIEF